MMAAEHDTVLFQLGGEDTNAYSLEVEVIDGVLAIYNATERRLRVISSDNGMALLVDLRAPE